MIRKHNRESVAMLAEKQHNRPDVTPHLNNKRRTKY
jgi:hypothetical protein